ncbi:MAG: hypothetical protein ACRDCW_18050 [Sarcina sp.]
MISKLEVHYPKKDIMSKQIPAFLLMLIFVVYLVVTIIKITILDITIKCVLVIIFGMLSIFLLYTIIMTIIKTLKNTPYFILDEQGFLFQGIYNNKIFIKWDNISSFEVVSFRNVVSLKINLIAYNDFMKEYGGVRRLIYILYKKTMKDESALIFSERFFKSQIDDVLNYLSKHVKK